ncbi:deoxynucleoside kinase [Fulvitalea axinellae]|uniref:Deoxynucleoside kinase n=1 Tax=Fulvitalea axinellae TaxID=1182444 RepID=A0AAU9DDY8_9BACT|nr:deoxynucleoside kinase [Fulvitalea axinellae]
MLKNYRAHIAVAGNIGSGKTTLTSMLAKHYGWVPEFENVDDNPYLPDFYADMEKWAFHLEIFFLKSRFNQLMRIKESEKVAVQDRTIYEGAHIFTQNLYDSGLLSDTDFDTYNTLYGLMKEMIRPPELLIYLKSDIPKLVRQVGIRNRDYESDIPTGYLQDLNEHYEKWISEYKEGKLLIIDVNDLDYENRPEDFEFVLQKVEDALSETALESITKN